MGGGIGERQPRESSHERISPMESAPMTDIKPRHLTHFEARYHRNGVAGAGFYLCRFKFQDTFLNAVVFDELGHIAITDGGSIGARYRGDVFEGAVRASIVAFEKKRPECVLETWAGYPRTAGVKP